MKRFILIIVSFFLLVDIAYADTKLYNVDWCSNIANNPTYVNDLNIQVVTPRNMQLLYRATYDYSDKIDANGNYIGGVAGKTADDYFYVLDSGVVTDDYIIFAQPNRSDTNTIIRFIDRATSKAVKSISSTQIGHANGMTYNSKTNKIVVTSNSTLKHLTVINPSTYAITGYINLPSSNGPIGVIEYDNGYYYTMRYQYNNAGYYYYDVFKLTESHVNGKVVTSPTYNSSNTISLGTKSFSFASANTMTYDEAKALSVGYQGYQDFAINNGLIYFTFWNGVNTGRCNRYRNNNYVLAYNMQGQLVKTFFFPNARLYEEDGSLSLINDQVDGVFAEIEFIDFDKNGDMVVGFGRSEAETYSNQNIYKVWVYKVPRFVLSDYTITSSVVRNIEPATNYGDIARTLGTYGNVSVNGSKVYNANMSKVEDDNYKTSKTLENAKTGDVMTISYAGESAANNKTYTMSVAGDVTGDGISDIDDAKAITRKIINNESAVNDAYSYAGDINNNGSLKMNDVMLLINKPNQSNET